MFKYLSFLLLFFLTQQLVANTFYEQLCNFNPNWKKYQNYAPKGASINFKTDNDLVQAHLKAVLKVLRHNPVDHLTTKQYKTRLHLMAVLNQYRKAGVFPQNYYREERIPVFIDEHNTHCAVGYLLQQTGFENVARRIAKKNNYAWVYEIDDPALPIWQKASGFTLEEIKLIQGAYDFYMPYALTAFNRFEIPQKPACISLYFEDKKSVKAAPHKEDRVWCYGEEKNGVLNGRWVQNYSHDLPWIVGFFEKGKRSGQWKEYYQGTNLLCRTEVWRNDELNGIRRRYNREGKLIEEILFKNGNAVKKTNHNFQSSLTWERTPIDSNLIYTVVYSFDGALLAKGYEKTKNPGNLQWFQDIELTALNTFAIKSRAYEQGNNSEVALYMAAPLVEYIKTENWTYYKEYLGNKPSTDFVSINRMLNNDYRFFNQDLKEAFNSFDDIVINEGFDSIVVNYFENSIIKLKGFGTTDFVHLEKEYFELPELNRGIIYLGSPFYGRLEPVYPLKATRQYTKNGEKTGLWEYYDKNQQLYKTVHFILPKKEDAIVEVTP